MPMSTPIFLTEADVGKLVTLNDAISALEKMLSRETGGKAHNIPKALATFAEKSSLHGLGSYSEDAQLGGFKTWINTPKGAMAVMSVFDTDLGKFRALMHSGLLGKLRTAGISGLATDWLAPADASDMAIVGTGRQAMLQIASVAAVRKLNRLRVYSPTEANRKAFVEQASTHFTFDVVEAKSVEEALDAAQIVTLVTRANAPFVAGDMLDDNAHVNAVGAILPRNAEIAASVISKARCVVVDSLDGVKRNSNEFKDYYGDQDDAWSPVRTMGQVIFEGRNTRPPGMTLFKAMGMGLSDLAVAEMVLARAYEQGIGYPLAEPEKALMPNWSEKT